MRIYKDAPVCTDRPDSTTTPADKIKRPRQCKLSETSANAKKLNRHSWSDFNQHVIANNLHNRYSWAEGDQKGPSTSVGKQARPHKLMSVIGNRMIKRSWTGSEVKLHCATNKESLKFYDRRNSLSVSNLSSSPSEKKPGESKWSVIRRRFCSTVCLF